MNSMLLVTSLLVLGLVSGQKCPSEKVNKEKTFYKWTETTRQNGKTKPVADQPCWFDLNR